MIPPRPAWHRNDEGSLLLVVMAMMMLTAMTSVLLVSVVNVTGGSVRDQRFTRTGIAAETGVQQGLFTLNTGGTPPPASAPASGPGPGRSTYTWYGTKPVAAENVWYVYSSGTEGNVRRSLVVKIVGDPGLPSTTTLSGVTTTTSVLPRWPYAVLADRSATLRGSTAVRSYNAVTRTFGTGRGSVGGNGTIFYSGTAAVDRTVLLNQSHYASVGARCSGTPCSAATTDAGGIDVASTSARAFMVNAVTSCRNAGSPVSVWVSSAHGGVLRQDAFGNCYSDVVFDQDTTVEATAGSPLRLYVTGRVIVGAGVRVNDNGVRTQSTILQVFSTGTGVYFGNGSTAGMAVWAPAALCAGNPSNGTLTFYGAMVCDTVSNQGGWSIHYDDALGYLTTATVVSTGGTVVWRIVSYQEERR